MSATVTAVEARETMVTDDEGIALIHFEVSQNVRSLLDTQRAKLDQVDAMKPGKLRYVEARAAGCFAAVAKGSKDRELKSNEIFIPGTELKVTNGMLRISAFKASLPCDFKARNVTFYRANEGEGPHFEHWAGVVEINPPLDAASV